MVRSFLGVPLFDRERRVRGGLLLGHREPDHFSQADETLLQALAAQAEVALENTRLYQNAQDRAQELSAVFESIADAVVVYDLEGNVQKENHAGALIRSLLAAQNQEAADATSAQDNLLTLLAQSSGRSAPGGREDAENAIANVPISLVDEQGERREYLVTGSRLRTESGPDAGTGETGSQKAPAAPSQATGTVVVWHEVTEARKLLTEQRARTEAEAQRTLLQLVIDELPSGVFLIRGTEARLVLANHAALEALGAYWQVGEPLAAFLARSGTHVAGVNGQRIGVTELASIQAVTTGTAVRHAQEIIQRPDGTSLPILTNAVALDWMLLSGLPLPDEPAMTSGDPVALVVFQDVSALKEAEQLKDEFIAVAAHELKTPMAAVKGYAGMLLRQSRKDKSSTLADWQKEALETIDQATNRLVELTDDLLDVARLQADHMPLHPEPQDLIALARRVMKRYQVIGPNHVITLAAPEEFVVANLDIRRTEQVVGNLLSNAIKYSPNGGDITVSVCRRQEAGMAELAITDQGIGIPVAQHALLFNRFARATNARELGIAGTGLGLYLCRELIERQGGRLWFTSEEGKGSVFTFRLPLAAPVAEDNAG
jgi:signal transduction histidine kinase